MLLLFLSLLLLLVLLYYFIISIISSMCSLIHDIILSQITLKSAAEEVFCL